MRHGPASQQRGFDPRVDRGFFLADDPKPALRRHPPSLAPRGRTDLHTDVAIRCARSSSQLSLLHTARDRDTACSALRNHGIKHLLHLEIGHETRRYSYAIKQLTLRTGPNRPEACLAPHFIAHRVAR